jgi:hypothetical protein
VLIHNTFAFTDGYCEKIGFHTHEKVIKSTHDNGMTRTKKLISYHEGSHPLPDDNNYSPRENITTIHDKKGNLIFSKHYTWEGKKLVKTIDDGVIRNIIQGKTPCDFAIIESSGDSIFFHLDPEKEPENTSFEKDDIFGIIPFMGGNDILFPDSKLSHKYNVIDAIVHYWYYFCKGFYETQKSSETSVSHLEQENKSDIDITDNDNSLSYTPPYKHYAIISICIIAASIVAVRRKWRTKK